MASFSALSRSFCFIAITILFLPSISQVSAAEETGDYLLSSYFDFEVGDMKRGTYAACNISDCVGAVTQRFEGVNCTGNSYFLPTSVVSDGCVEECFVRCPGFAPGCHAKAD